MSDVLDAAKDGAEILVCAGRHNVDCPVLLNQKLTMRPIEGLASRPELVRKFEGLSFVVVGHADAVLRGLVLDDNKYYTMNVQVNAGLIVDCVISNGNYTSGYGIGLGMVGGVADRCVIVGTRGSAGADLNSSGLAVHLTGNAILRNSLVRGNYADSATTGRSGGIVALRQNAVMENCTITGNTNRQYSVVTALGGGTIRNCIIWGNECGAASLDGSPYWPAFAPYTYLSNIYTLSDAGVTFFDYNCVSANAFGARKSGR